MSLTKILKNLINNPLNHFNSNYIMEKVKESFCTQVYEAPVMETIELEAENPILDSGTSSVPQFSPNPWNEE
jgi:hypothetical protein